MSFQDTTIAFIGAGNMATALIQGLIANGVASGNIWASDPEQSRLAGLKSQYDININASNLEIIRRADVVILAVKPQVVGTVLEAIQAGLEAKNCLLISIAAGINLQSLTRWTSSRQAIVRCMPNTPALVLAGASGLYANASTSAEQKQLAENILCAVGSVSWLSDEKDMDAVTALSGSGPAYFFLLMEAMQDAAVKLGLSPETASSLCVQTAFGAAKLAQSSAVDIAELRRQVTSPGGTTEAALNQFEADKFRDIVDHALGKAAARSQELAEILGNTDK